MFPAEFVGVRHESGGLLLRSARDQVQLKYVPVAGGVRTVRACKIAKAQRSDVLIGRSKQPPSVCANGGNTFRWRSRLGKDIFLSRAFLGNHVRISSICCARGSGNSFSLPPACRTDNRL